MRKVGGPVFGVIEIGLGELVLFGTIFSGVVVGAIKALDLISKMWEERRNGGRKKAATKKDPLTKLLGECLALLREMRSESKDLHTWHAVEDPRQPGVKVWWNAEEQKEQLRIVEGRVAALTDDLLGIQSAHEKCNEAQVEFIHQQRDEIETLRARVDELQEKWREEIRDLMRELIEFSSRFERGMDGRRAPSGAYLSTTAEDDGAEEDEFEDEENGEGGGEV